MSLGTTLRLPLGNRVEVMDVRRLRGKKKNTQVKLFCVSWISAELSFPASCKYEGRARLTLTVCYLCVPVLLSHLIRIM